MLSHQNLSANARQVVGLDPLPGTEDRIVGVLPLFHVFANTCVLNRTVANRGCMVLLPRFHAGQVLSTLDRTAATALPGEIGRAHVELQSLMRLSYSVFAL